MGPHLRVTLAALVVLAALFAAYFEGRRDGRDLGRAEGIEAASEQMQVTAVRLARQVNHPDWPELDPTFGDAPATQPAASSPNATERPIPAIQFAADRPVR